MEELLKINDILQKINVFNGISKGLHKSELVKLKELELRIMALEHEMQKKRSNQ